MNPVEKNKVLPRRTRGDRAHSPSRERVLREIETRGPVSVTEIVRSLGLHENTVRGHVSRLRDDGHIVGIIDESSSRGRPTVRWSAPPAETRNPYAALAVTLASALLTPIDGASTRPTSPVTIVRRAGLDWGAALVDGRAYAREVSTATVIAEIMEEQGFAPAPIDGGTGQYSSFALTACPLLAAATEHRSVVCAAHAGMVEGIVRARGATLDVQLTPFTSPGVCELALRPREAPAAEVAP